MKKKKTKIQKKNNVKTNNKTIKMIHTKKNLMKSTERDENKNIIN